MDEFMINAKISNKKNKIIDELDDIDNIVLPSSIKKVIEPSPKKEPELSEDTDEWLNELMCFTSPKPKKKKNKQFKGFLSDDQVIKKTSKSKKQKNGEMKDYYKEFEPELALLKNLYMQQSKFTDVLQKKFDEIEKSKSTSRGVGKFTTDLINSISQARSTALQIMDKTINTKKIIADLNVKERKEFSNKNSSAQENNVEFASTFLKKIIDTGRQNIIDTPVTYDEIPQDSTDIDLFASIEDSIGESTRNPDINKYLEYESKGGVVISVIRDRDGDWDFIATDKNGNIVTDYPLPKKSHMSFNPSLKLAIDDYGQKYPLIEQ